MTNKPTRLKNAAITRAVSKNSFWGTVANYANELAPVAGQGRLKVISSRARCHASHCEHSPDVVAQFLLARVN